MLKTTLIAALLAFCVASVAQSQRAETLASGMRVRITVDTGQKVVGTLAGLSADSVFISNASGKGAVLALSRKEILVLERSTGKSRVVGALAGTAVGVLLGGITGAIVGSNQPEATYAEETISVCGLFGGCHTETARVCKKNCIRLGPAVHAIAFAALGIPIGAITGAAIGTEKWAVFH